ncbi:MAG: hypothetical protein S4CHLAM123_07020 [Chlamydiales bacterium]|nr:hypothetical protein [Chlamydiales bacterium]
MRLLDFIFPPLCLHCGIDLKSQKRLFCDHCSSDFQLLHVQNRCPYCFSEQQSASPCSECIEHKKWQVRMGSALEYTGAVKTLVKQLKKGDMPYLAKTGAAFLLLQLTALKWPLPDVIVPVPARGLFQQRNHASLLASHLAKALQVESQPLVKRRAGDLSQAKLSKVQREQLLAQNFYLKKNTVLDHQTVLLVDDVFTTGTTLRHSASALWTAFPKKIYALSLACASFF